MMNEIDFFSGGYEDPIENGSSSEVKFYTECSNCADVVDDFINYKYEVEHGLLTISSTAMRPDIDGEMVFEVELTNTGEKLYTVDKMEVVNGLLTAQFSGLPTLGSGDEYGFPYQISIVARSQDFSKGCLFEKDINGVERDKLVVARVDDTFTVGYEPTDSAIDIDMEGSNFIWRINGAILDNENSNSLTVSNSRLISLGITGDAAVTVEFVGSVLECGKIRVELDPYNQAMSFESVINLEDLYINAIVSCQDDYQLFYENKCFNGVMLADLYNDKQIMMVSVNNPSEYSIGESFSDEEYSRYNWFKNFEIPHFHIVNFLPKGFNAVDGEYLKNTNTGAAKRIVPLRNLDASTYLDEHKLNILHYDNLNVIRESVYVADEPEQPRAGLIHQRYNETGDVSLHVYTDDLIPVEVELKNMSSKIITTENNDSDTFIIDVPDVQYYFTTGDTSLLHYDASTGISTIEDEDNLVFGRELGVENLMQLEFVIEYNGVTSPVGSGVWITIHNNYGTPLSRYGIVRGDNGLTALMDESGNTLLTQDSYSHSFLVRTTSQMDISFLSLTFNNATTDSFCISNIAITTRT